MSQTLRDVREVIREETLMHKPILEAVGDEALTVPEIAEKIGFPAHEVLYWVMGMRRYGFLIEDGDEEDGYYSYKATGRQV